MSYSILSICSSDFPELLNVRVTPSVVESAPVESVDSGGVRVGSSACILRIRLSARNFRARWVRRDINCSLTDERPIHSTANRDHLATFLFQLFLVIVSLVSGAIFPAHAFAREQPGTALADAAERKNWEELNTRLNGATAQDVNVAQADGMTALHWAVFYQQDDVVEQLLKRDAKVHSKTAYNITPLSLAVETGTAESVSMLLAAGADPNDRRLGEETPLMLAARRGAPAVVQSLIGAGADVNAKEVRDQTALMWAAEAGNAAVVKTLLDSGADLNRSLESGFTAFLFAARQGKLECVRVLLLSLIHI